MTASSATFLGYHRPDDSVGARNYVLLLPADRFMNMLCQRVAQAVPGTKTLVTPGEFGRPKEDRELLARVLIGLGRNPNASAVIVVGMGERWGYTELYASLLAEEISKGGKPVELVTVEKAVGLHKAVEQATELARKLVRRASAERRQTFGLDQLTIAVKCGMSDPTSGIVGNPAIGLVFDRVVQAGGTALFGETTEVIGAEHILAQRMAFPEVRERFLSLVKEHEERAKATGQDIRTINPVPANIKAGISTLEEKSLGAVAKAGSMPIEGVLDYGERPAGKGLYFMDSWPMGHSIFAGYAASGANVALFQLGGGALPQVDPPLPAISSGVVTPIIMCTGNPRTYAKAMNNLDYSSGPVVEGKENLEQAAERLLSQILAVASGELTKGESWSYDEPVELPFKGPLL